MCYTDYSIQINTYLTHLKTSLNGLDIKKISDVINVLKIAFAENKTIYVFGNGGSAATASHIGNDFGVGLFGIAEKKLRIHCLSDNIVTITCIANDYSYDEIYVRQLQNKLRREDIVIAISGSGNSENVIKAVEYAKQLGSTVIGFTGFDGGKLFHLADYNLHVDVNNMQITEDIHLVFNHLLMTILKEVLKND